MTIESVFEANKEPCPARYKVPGTGQEDIYSCELNNHNKYCAVKNCTHIYWLSKFLKQRSGKEGLPNRRIGDGYD